MKTYTDLGTACYGKTGTISVALIIIINQMLTCSGYILFFTDLILRMIGEVTENANYEDLKIIIFGVSILVLIPLSLFE